MKKGLLIIMATAYILGFNVQISSNNQSIWLAMSSVFANTECHGGDVCVWGPGETGGNNCRGAGCVTGGGGGTGGGSVEGSSGAGNRGGSGGGGNGNGDKDEDKDNNEDEEEEQKENREQCKARHKHDKDLCDLEARKYYKRTTYACAPLEQNEALAARVGVRIFLDFTGSSSITIHHWAKCNTVAEATRDVGLAQCQVDYSGNVKSCPAE